MKRKESSLTRRDLLTAAVRAGGVAALGGLAWMLGRRRSGDGACASDSRCGHCGLFAGCELGPAREHRKALEDGHAG